MTDRTASVTLNRLRAVEWVGDWDHVLARVMSRRVLMREYLRRAALWAQEYSAESAWPFFDVSEYVDPGFRLSPETAAELDAYLGRVPGSEIRETCAGAVRLAEMREQNPAALPDLPDLYEPLVLFYERGGEFVRDNAGGLDLTGVSFRPGTPQGNLSTPPFRALNETVLDALDARGRVSYYAVDGPQALLVRRRVVRGERHDELFGPDLRWEPTDRLPEKEEAIKGAGLVPLDEIAAAELIGDAVDRASR
ncbi:hypothetical protein [Streptomyces erythrochromogenes]|uniref:hypothetical protein n=1 Tax=Streptomyces erythrochromogenes TaxID=285574 RepID=UPI00068EB423|nr:hypothetical protein [Streptomyces erythrochromogenes]